MRVGKYMSEWDPWGSMYFPEEKQEKQVPLTEKQKALIELFQDGQCTDVYLTTKLGIFDWKDAQKLIEQYEREGK